MFPVQLELWRENEGSGQKVMEAEEGIQTSFPFSLFKNKVAFAKNIQAIDSYLIFGKFLSDKYDLWFSIALIINLWLNFAFSAEKDTPVRKK